MCQKNILVITLITLMSLGISACGGSTSVESSTNSTQEDAPQPITSTSEESSNHPPVAQIDGNNEAISGETVSLDGASSLDPDDDTLSFFWEQTQGLAIDLADRSNPLLSFILPNLDQPTMFSFQLTVSDGEHSDSVTFDLLILPLIDTTSPSIVSKTPQHNASDVATTTEISITLDEPLLETSIDSDSLQLSAYASTITGNISYNSNTYRLIFTPDSLLTENTIYSVYMNNGLQDLAGNTIQAESWSFSTGSQYNLGQTQQDTIDLCMDDSDKLMLTLVNNARAIERLCGSTNYSAVSAISWHCSLEQAAQGHSTSMADNDYFSHTGLDGSSPGDRITAAGYPWRTYGENIAAGYFNADDVINAWLNSPGHCANIMNPNFTEIGVATAENFTSQYGIYWTQNFADR